MDVDTAVLGGGFGDRIPTKLWAHTALALAHSPTAMTQARTGGDR